MREQPVRDVAEYQDRRWWASEIPAHPSCRLTAATGDEAWLTVSKAHIPPAPPVPHDIAAYLRTGVTDPEREPAFDPDFDDAFADEPEEADRLRDPSHVRNYGAPEWRTFFELAGLEVADEALLVRDTDLADWLDRTETPDDVRPRVRELLESRIVNGRLELPTVVLKGTKAA